MMWIDRYHPKTGQFEESVQVRLNKKFKIVFRDDLYIVKYIDLDLTHGSPIRVYRKCFPVAWSKDLEITKSISNRLLDYYEDAPQDM